VAIVAIGRVGEQIVVPTAVCVKSGVATTDRVIIRGSTTPAWVSALLLFTVIGWLFASGMAARSYRVDVPFRHDIHDRWQRFYRIAWGFGVVGAAGTVGAIIAGMDHALMPLVLSVAGLVTGLVNGLTNNVGVRQIDVDRLAMTRVNDAAAAAITRARATPQPAA
jgi:hypothetical protein